MSGQTFVVNMSNQDIVLRVAQTSFGAVRVVNTFFGTVKVAGGVPGPPGQDGVDGVDGAPGSGFNFVQASPASTWLINHNLGFKPSIDLLSIGGMEMLGEVVHTSDNQIVVNFNGAVSGFARLS